jgi:hypothetical protein
MNLKNCTFPPSRTKKLTTLTFLMFGIFCSFVLTKTCQDLIVSYRSYGHGRMIYPVIVAVLSSVGCLLQKHRCSSRLKLFFKFLWRAWLCASIGMLVDAAVNQYIWDQLTRSWHSRYGIFTSILFGPWIILTPLIVAITLFLLHELKEKMNRHAL